MNILMGIPTRNRARMVEEVLEFEAWYYKNSGIRICYYDSSENDDTHRVITAANEKYALDIIYKRSDPQLCLDYKLIEILKDFEKTEYEYLWLVNDSISISREMLEEVARAAEQRYDLIRLPLAGEGCQKDIITNDPNVWFHECSQGMAHMASTVMRRTLLTGAGCKWDLYREKYVGSNVLDENHGYFFMVAFYLEQIAHLPQFKGIFMGNRVKWRRDSPLKKDQIYWRNYVFPAWAKSYPETIFKLPDLYTDKEDVIRKSDNILPGRFSKSMLIHYRLRNIYDFSVYKRYKKYFPYITEESFKQCLLVALTPRALLKRRYRYLISGEENWQENLERIEQKVKGRDILIYGAGLYGGKVLHKLTDDGFGSRILGIAVTDTRGNMPALEGCPVKSIDSFVHVRESVFVIVCALPAMSLEMKSELKKRKFRYYTTLFGV